MEFANTAGRIGSRLIPTTARRRGHRALSPRPERCSASGHIPELQGNAAHTGRGAQAHARHLQTIRPLSRRESRIR